MCNFWKHAIPRLTYVDIECLQISWPAPYGQGPHGNPGDATNLSNNASASALNFECRCMLLLWPFALSLWFLTWLWRWRVFSCLLLLLLLLVLPPIYVFLEHLFIPVDRIPVPAAVFVVQSTAVAAAGVGFKIRLGSFLFFSLLVVSCSWWLGDRELSPKRILSFHGRQRQYLGSPKVQIVWRSSISTAVWCSTTSDLVSCSVRFSAFLYLFNSLSLIGVGRLKKQKEIKRCKKQKKGAKNRSGHGDLSSHASSPPEVEIDVCAACALAISRSTSKPFSTFGRSACGCDLSGRRPWMTLDDFG